MDKGTRYPLHSSARKTMEDHWFAGSDLVEETSKETDR